MTDPVLPEPPPSEDGALLLQCLGLDHAERRQALEQLCRQHPERAATLRELYGRLDDFGLVDEPVPEAALAERFGPYRLLGVLGSGGMGVVYLAMHEALGRKVALKVIQPGHRAPPRARERFRREVHAVSRLEHPNICPVYDAGEVDGVPFLALRYVDGETLQHRLDRQRQEAQRSDVGAVVAIGERLARALHAAHERGLVHRDVKPGNVMLEAGTGVPLLLDFGLARLDDGDTPALTRSSDKLGTPAYMAPEQVAGEPTDRRTDVYAIGATLYEALTLRPPHEAPTLDALYRRIVAGEVTRPGRHDPRIGRDLEVVLETALDRDPDRRYATADALADDLVRVQRHEPIRARRAGPLLRLRRFAQRNPVAAGFVGFLVVAVVAFALLLRDSAANLRRATANEQALRATEMGRMSPRRALASALAAVELDDNVDTISSLHAAVVHDHEAACVQHDGSLYIAEFSRDGELILTCGQGTSARLFDRDGLPVASLPHRGPVWWAEFDRDGERVLTTSLDGVVALWRTDGQPVRSWPHPARPYSGRFAPSGRQIVTICADRRARIYDCESGAQIGPDMEHEGALGFVAWSARGWIVTTEDRVQTNTDAHQADYEVRVWQPGVDGHAAMLGRRLPASVPYAEFDARGDSLVVACLDGNAYVFDLASPAADPVALPHRAGVWRAAFSPDGARIVTASDDNTAALWHRDGTLLRVAAHDGPVFHASFEADGARVVTTSLDNSVRVFDEALHQLLVLRGHTEKPWMAHVSPDGRSVVSVSWDHTLRIWGLVDARVPCLLGHTACVRGLGRLADGSVVSVADDGSLRHWDLVSGVGRVVPIAASPTGLWLCETPDATSVLVGHGDGVARRYDPLTGELLAQYRDPSGEGGAIAVLPDGRVLTAGRLHTCHVFQPENDACADWGEGTRNGTYALATTASGLVAAVGWDAHLTIWDAKGARVAHFLIDPAWPVDGDQAWSHAVAFSPRGDRIAVGSADGVARVFALRNGLPVDAHRPLKLRVHDGAAVRAIAWSPDGSRIATGASDGAARVWDARTGKLAAVHRGHTAAVTAVLFTEDGRLITAGDAVIRFWLTSPTELMAATKRRLGR